MKAFFIFLLWNLPTLPYVQCAFASSLNSKVSERGAMGSLSPVLSEHPGPCISGGRWAGRIHECELYYVSKVRFLNLSCRGSVHSLKWHAKFFTYEHKWRERSITFNRVSKGFISDHMKYCSPRWLKYLLNKLVSSQHNAWCARLRNAFAEWRELLACQRDSFGAWGCLCFYLRQTLGNWNENYKYFI